ncbi:membrane-associated phospholipid phosphatase [Streptacidiphilus sp. MAP12-33]|uniref:phosphatase PAP2 family protein n=1 Tax=Streptacidiphilus sp. MAP12-33 TaxID=3156266 RepID=UPI003517588A
MSFEAQTTPGPPVRPLTGDDTGDHVPVAPRRAAVIAGVALLAAGASVGLALTWEPHGFVQSMDGSWASSMTGRQGGLLTLVAVMVEGGFGGPAGLVAWGVLVGWLLALGRRWSALCAVSGAVASNIVLLPIKTIVGRARPDEPLVLVSGASFPSAHACSAAALTVLVGLLVFSGRGRRLWWPVGGLATVLDMWSATWLQANWLSDVVAGACFGAGAALLLWRAFARPLLREGPAQA